MATLTAEYLDDFARVMLTADDLAPEVIYTIERSIDGGVTWSTVRGATNVTDGGVTVVYDYEYAPNDENRYRLVEPVISDTFERTVGPPGLVLDGTTGSYASTPDTAALDITDTIDIRIEVWREDWSAPAAEEVMIAKYVDTTDNRSWRFTFDTNGMLQFRWSSDGANTKTAWSSVAPVEGTGPAYVALRVVRDHTTGNVTFYTTTSLYESDSAWEVLGEIQSSTPGTMYSSSADLEIGARDNGSRTPWNGRIRGAILEHNGAEVCQVDFTEQPTGTTAFNDTDGHAWTVHGTASITGNDLAWGDADTGQTWTEYVDNGFTPSMWSVSDGAGRVETPPSAFSFYGRYLPGAYDDVTIRYDVIMPSMGATPTGNDEMEYDLYVRGTDEVAVGYSIQFLIDNSTKTATLNVGNTGGTVEAVEVGTWQPGQRWRIRARVVGTVIEARAWNTANAEPGTWHVTTTSTLHTSGTIGFAALPIVNPEVEFVIDDFIAESVPPAGAATAIVTPTQNTVWLKSIQYPSLNRSLGECILTGERARRSRVGLFDVKGRHQVLGIADVGSTETTSIQFVTTSRADNEAIVALLTWGAPLLLQTPPDDDTDDCGPIAASPAGWFMPGDHTQVRPLVGRRAWAWLLPITRVAAPAATILPAHMTWDVLWQLKNTWVDVWDEWSTWAELWDASVAPGVMASALGGE